MNTLLDLGCNTLGGYDHLQKYEDISGHEIKKIFVEANPECWSEIEKKLKHIANATLVKKAISLHDRGVELITRSDVSSDIGATILGENYLKSSLSKCNMYVDKFNTYNVESTTIEKIVREFDIVPENTILKMDIEGVEYDILNDIILYNLHFKKIYCEFHTHTESDYNKKIELLNLFAQKGITVIDWQ
jgi:FkbM family methyltransferase